MRPEAEAEQTTPDRPEGVHLQLQTDKLLGERYRLLRRIGAGGMATVWLGRDTRLGRDVAVKLLSDALISQPGFVERFEQEARIAARLSHPHLVAVHDLGVEQERPFLVMEYVEGETLAQRVERDPASVDREQIAVAMLSALSHIHGVGVVHRDLKPANLIFDGDDEVRLTDFGIARMLEGTNLTETGQVIGTLRYMAPELRHGEAPTPRTDLYALGVLLAELDGGGDTLDPLCDALRNADPERRPADAEAALAMLTPSAGRAKAEEYRPEPNRTAAAPSPAPESPALRDARTLAERRRQETSAPAAAPDSTAPERSNQPDRPASRLRLPALGLALALLAGVVIAIGSIAGSGEGGEDAGNPSGSVERQSDEESNGGGPGGGDADDQQEPDTPDNGEARTASAGDVPAPAPNPDPARGSQLNQEGYSLLESGDAEGAVPVLRRAVRSYPEGSQDLEYAYALFNYGRALRLAGDPAAAIPVLERRLQFNDQRPTVREELRQARSEAG